MRNQEIKNANYKTGVKILTEEQMQAGLPTYDLLLSKIEMQIPGFPLFCYGKMIA